MSESPSFDRLLSDIQNGDTKEAGRVIELRFTNRLAALTASKLSERLRRRVGADDVVQSVYRTFFRRLNDGGLELLDWESLWALLARIAVRRTRHHARQAATAKRSQDRETPLTPEIELFDQVPGPESLMMTEELRNTLVEEMRDKYRPILERILEGHTHDEIARELATSISTVERVHRKAREILKKLLAAEI